MSRLMEMSFGRVSRSRGPGLLARIDQAFALHRSRARLAQLDARLLADVGLDRSTAEAEAKRPVWDAPSHWSQ